MARFLSEEWFALLEGLPVSPDVDARVGYVITGGPAGEVRYVLAAHDGRLRVAPDGPTDITVRTDHATAVELATGRCTAHDAFLAGKVRFAGDLGRLQSLTAAVAARGDALAAVRDATTHDVR